MKKQMLMICVLIVGMIMLQGCAGIEIQQAQQEIMQENIRELNKLRIEVYALKSPAPTVVHPVVEVRSAALVGMHDYDVRMLLSTPRKICRTVTSSGSYEIWLYGQDYPYIPRMNVQFLNGVVTQYNTYSEIGSDWRNTKRAQLPFDYEW